MRPLEITRREAEDLVDLLEANDAGNPSRSELARDLREKYGMVPRELDARKAEGTQASPEYRLARSVGAAFVQGDPVSKVGGDYRFDGTVIGVFVKLSGAVRYAVEDDRGVIHIYSAKNLVKR